MLAGLWDSKAFLTGAVLGLAYVCFTATLRRALVDEPGAVELPRSHADYQWSLDHHFLPAATGAVAAHTAQASPKIGGMRGPPPPQQQQPPVAVARNEPLQEPGSYADALQWIYQTQHPVDGCGQGSNATRKMMMGTMGGFASNFQKLGTSFAELLARGEIAVPWGHLGPYTNNPVCRDLLAKASGGSSAETTLGCFFELPSSCASGKLKRMADTSHKGKGGNLRTNVEALAKRVPDRFPKTLPFWWGAVQDYLFRPTDRMAKRLAEVKGELGYTRPSIAAHIRIGDKLGDPMSRQGKQKHATYIKRHTDQLQRFVDMMVAAPSDSVAAGSPIEIYVASDSALAIETVKAWGETRAQNVKVVCRSTESQNVSGATVATADFMRQQEGSKYNLAEEIVIDMQLLLGAKYFLGLCMSQVARVVVSIGFGRGELLVAVAMDQPNTKRLLQHLDRSKMGDSMPWSMPTIGTS